MQHAQVLQCNGHHLMQQSCAPVFGRQLQVGVAGRLTVEDGDEAEFGRFPQKHFFRQWPMFQIGGAMPTPVVEPIRLLTPLAAAITQE